VKFHLPETPVRHRTVPSDDSASRSDANRLASVGSGVAVRVPVTDCRGERTLADPMVTDLRPVVEGQRSHATDARDDRIPVGEDDSAVATDGVDLRADREVSLPADAPVVGIECGRLTVRHDDGEHVASGHRVGRGPDARCRLALPDERGFVGRCRRPLGVCTNPSDGGDRSVSGSFDRRQLAPPRRAATPKAAPTRRRKRLREFIV